MDSVPVYLIFMDSLTAIFLLSEIRVWYTITMASRELVKKAVFL